MKNIIILMIMPGLLSVTAACTKEEIQDSLEWSVDEHVNEVVNGNPKINYPHNLKFIYDSSGRLSSLQDSLLSGGPPAVSTYAINYWSDGRVQNLTKAGISVQECVWSSENDVTVYLPDSENPYYTYKIKYNQDGSLMQKERYLGSTTPDFRLLYYWEEGNIVKIENYIGDKLRKVDVYTYSDVPNPFSSIPRALVLVDGYLKRETRNSANNVETGYTAYFNSQGDEYLRYQHIWSYTYDVNNRLDSFGFQLDIPQTDLMSNYYSENYTMHYF
ncbi:MAG TPA: hypothetical protein VMV47_08560 [Bacteroidales bacterium]|nr:hypothetical protein [Bacteroidales bacterium]